jgi:hypothetical protein
VPQAITPGQIDHLSDPTAVGFSIELLVKLHGVRSGSAVLTLSDAPKYLCVGRDLGSLGFARDDTKTN